MRRTLLPALVLAAALAPAAALAGKTAPPGPDCQFLRELYGHCHRLGQQSGGVQTCLEGAQDYTARAETRAARDPQAARALAELVCGAGCEDAAAGLAPPTAQEFSEAFCDTAQPGKAQGARP